MKQKISDLHRALLRGFIEDGAPPAVAEIATRSGVSHKEVRTRLRALAEYHGAVLHPHNDEPWVVHPFTTSATAFSVHKAGRSWSSPCAWCALGAAALLGGEVMIRTRDGGVGDPLELIIRAGMPDRLDLRIHFPIPMTQAWDNVLYTCSVMLLFKDEASVDAWCARNNMAKGDVRSMEAFWPFAREWYGHHLDATWRKWDLAQARALIEKHGLDGPIWSLAQGKERF